MYFWGSFIYFSEDRSLSRIKRSFCSYLYMKHFLEEKCSFYFLTRRYLIKQVNDLALNLYISIRMRDDLSLLLVISIRLIPPLHNTLEQNYRILCFKNEYEVFQVFIHTFNFSPFWLYKYLNLNT